MGRGRVTMGRVTTILANATMRYAALQLYRNRQSANRLGVRKKNQNEQKSDEKKNENFKIANACEIIVILYTVQTAHVKSRSLLLQWSLSSARLLLTVWCVHTVSRSNPKLVGTNNTL